MSGRHGFDRHARVIEVGSPAARRNAQTQMPLNSITCDFSDAYTKEKIVGENREQAGRIDRAVNAGGRSHRMRRCARI
jgi:hypothetical protein